MNAASPFLFQGRIIWREVPNLINDGEKRRPLIIISSPADVKNGSTVFCVACSHSTAILAELPAGCIPIPPKIGKRATKLNKPTAAVCYWIVEIEKASISKDDLAGSTGEYVLADVLAASKQYVEQFLSSR